MWEQRERLLHSGEGVWHGVWWAYGMACVGVGCEWGGGVWVWALHGEVRPRDLPHDIVTCLLCHLDLGILTRRPCSLDLFVI